MHQGGVRTIVRAMIIIATTGLFNCGLAALAIAPTDLVISKVQISGGLGKTSEDFVSIYNKTNSVIDLNGLRLVKRTKTGTTDTTLKSWVSSTLLNPSSYYTWACSANDFATSINADASSAQTISDDNGVAIRAGAENTGTIIDSLGWGSAANSFVETSPSPSNPGANERLERINNLDTNNNAADFQIIKPIIPPVCGNSIIETEESCDDGNIISLDGCSATCQAEISQAICGNNLLETGEACDDGNILNNDGCNNLCQIENQTSILGDVMINELVSDPATGDEWLELYNTTSQDIDLTNWTIEDGSGTKTILSGVVNKFFVITKPKGALNNAGDIIILKNSDGDIIDSITYGDWDDGDTNNNAPTAASPNSLARIMNGESTGNDGADFKVTTSVTKGLANIITEPSDDIIEETNTVTETGYDYSRDIIISEIFPNPLGLDSVATNGEFIELYNSGDKNVPLKGWRLEVDNIALEIPADTIIYNHQYLNINTKNNLPLPNDGATVKLFQPQRQTSYQSVTYKTSQENKSYANFFANGWQWTARTTPGAENIQAPTPVANFELIDEPVVGQSLLFDSSDSFLGPKTGQFSWNFGDGFTSNLANPLHVFTKTGKTKISLTIKTDYGSSTVAKNITLKAKEKLQDEEEINTNSETVENSDLNVDGLKIASTSKDGSFTTAGTAISAVGIFGTQYFYFLSEQGEPLLQVYNAKKLFPKIKAGDQLIVTGEYSERPEGPRLKTKEAKDIQIIGTENIVVPKVSSSADLKTGPYPRLALVEGEVVSKKLPRVYLADQQGEIELYLTAGTKLKSADFTIGDRLSVFGVLTTLNGEIRLQPRSADDIKKIEISDFSIANIDGSTTSTKSPEINITTEPTESKKKIIFYYLLAGGIIMVGGTIFYLYKK